MSQQGFGKTVENSPRDCDHLQPLPIANWRRLTFVSFDPAARPFTDEFAAIDDSLAKMPAMPDRMSAEIRDVAGNWKQHAWNYLDQFHIGFVHRAPGGLADAVDLASYTTEIHGNNVLQCVYASNAADGFDPAWLPERFHDPKGRRVFALWWFVFPNLTLNFYPWGLSVNVYNPVPIVPTPRGSSGTSSRSIVRSTPSATVAGSARKSTPRTSTRSRRSAVVSARVGHLLRRTRMYAWIHLGWVPCPRVPIEDG